MSIRISLFGHLERSQLCFTSYHKRPQFNEQNFHGLCNPSPFSVMMLSLTVTIIELAALSLVNIGVSADQTALLLFATCIPAVIGPPPEKGEKEKPPLVFHNCPPGGCLVKYWIDGTFYWPRAFYCCKMCKKSKSPPFLYYKIRLFFCAGDLCSAPGLASRD